VVLSMTDLHVEETSGSNAPATTSGRSDGADGAEAVTDPVVAGDGIRAAGRWRRTARAVDVVGRVLIVLGGLVLSFMAFQLWGTAVQHDQAQSELADELSRRIAQHRSQPQVEPVDQAVSQADPAPSPEVVEREMSGVVTVPSRPRPDAGAAIARIEAPTIGLDKTVVEGVGRPQLRAGPGLYPVSPLPGHQGNVAIAGHRTTHGSPFAQLNKLAPGDPITLETIDGAFVYRVEGQRTDEGEVIGHRIVAPDAVEVVADVGDNRLTLTSCHPRYSDRQRLVVTAVLEGPAVTFPVQQGPGRSMIADRLESSVGSERGLVAGAEPGGSPPSEVGAPPISGLEEPLGWQLDRLPEATIWALAAVAALIPSALLHRRRRRVLAVLALVVCAGYPFVSLLSVLDKMAPAW